MKPTIPEKVSLESATQEQMKPHYRSKSTMRTNQPTSSIAVSSIKIDLVNTATSLVQHLANIAFYRSDSSSTNEQTIPKQIYRGIQSQSIPLRKNSQLINLTKTFVLYIIISIEQNPCIFLGLPADDLFCH